MPKRAPHFACSEGVCEVQARSKEDSVVYAACLVGKPPSSLTCGAPPGAPVWPRGRVWSLTEALTGVDGAFAVPKVVSLRPLRPTPGSIASGRGLAMGAGAALAARLQGSPRRAFVLLSDGECNEGSVWESAMFAAHQELSNLVVLVDMNGQQALGYTRHVLDLEPMDRRWEAFGWDDRVVDGHDVGAMLQAIEGLDPVTGP